MLWCVAELILLASFLEQEPEDRPDFETVIGRLRRMLAVETLAKQPSGAAQPPASYAASAITRHVLSCAGTFMCVLAFRIRQKAASA